MTGTAASVMTDEQIWDLVWWYIEVVAAAGAFGGFVHGLLRRRVKGYVVTWPWRGKTSQVGFVGDLFVGVAAGVTVFVVMESVFGMELGAAAKNPQAIAKIIALGLICGYMGPGLLDAMAMMVSKRLLKVEEDLEDQVKKLEDRMKAESRADELCDLADAYHRWKMYPQAIELYDQAIMLDPSRADSYVHKSFAYAEEAEAKDKEQRHDEAVGLYEIAIGLTDQAIKVDEACARAYYDRACYRHCKDRTNSRKEVIADLEVAFSKAAILKKMAQHDPDFDDLRSDEAFKKLMAVGAGDGAIEASAGA